MSLKGPVIADHIHSEDAQPSPIGAVGAVVQPEPEYPPLQEYEQDALALLEYVQACSYSVGE